MEVRKTTIVGLLVVQMAPINDVRGAFIEIFERDAFLLAGIDADFSQETISRSDKAGTLRGLHFQTAPFAQAKLVRCVRGKIWDVTVDLRKSSPSYLEKLSIELAEDDWQWLYLPTGIAHGFSTLTDNTEVAYKIAGKYSPEHATGINWRDPEFDIDWRVDAEDVILSDRDKNLPNFEQNRIYFP